MLEAVLRRYPLGIPKRTPKIIERKDLHYGKDATIENKYLKKYLTAKILIKLSTKTVTYGDFMAHPRGSSTPNTCAELLLTS